MSYPPLRSNINTKNSHVWMEGDTFSEASFVGYLCKLFDSFGGCMFHEILCSNDFQQEWEGLSRSFVPFQLFEFYVQPDSWDSCGTWNPNWWTCFRWPEINAQLTDVNNAESKFIESMQKLCSSVLHGPVCWKGSGTGTWYVAYCFRWGDQKTSLFRLGGINMNWI